jgi:hypothetical protein
MEVSAVVEQGTRAVHSNRYLSLAMKIWQL